jgi:hypothetical protein
VSEFPVLDALAVWVEDNLTLPDELATTPWGDGTYISTGMDVDPPRAGLTLAFIPYGGSEAQLPEYVEGRFQAVARGIGSFNLLSALYNKIDGLELTLPEVGWVMITGIQSEPTLVEPEDTGGFRAVQNYRLTYTMSG